MKTNNYYIDNNELLGELLKWRDSAEKPEDRQPSERLGELLIKLHDRILCHKNFVGYRPDLKEEMKSFSLFRIFKRGLFSYKFDKQNPFGYFTRSIFLNYYTVIGHYYKKLNLHQEYVKGLLAKIDFSGLPKIKQFLEQFLTSR